MTAEQVEAQVAAWEAASYVQFAVPDVPYSAIRFPLVDSPIEAAALADRALKMAAYLQRKFHEAFPSETPPQHVEPHQEPQERARRPAPQRQAPRGARGERSMPRARGGGTGLYCPEHDVEVLKTSARYDKDGDRYYHRLPEDDWYEMDDGRTAKNHNLYMRQLMDVNGKAIEDEDAEPY